MTTFRCPRSRSTRRDPLPTPCGLSDTGPGSSGSRCPLLTAWPRGHPRSAIQVLFLLACLPLCCLWCWSAHGAGAEGEYYEKINGRDLVHRLGRSVEGVASGRGSVAGNRACPSAPSPPPGARYSVAQARTDSKESLSRRPSDPGCVLATGAGYRRWLQVLATGAGYRCCLRRRLAAYLTPPAGFLQRILSGAPSCASISPQH